MGTAFPPAGGGGDPGPTEGRVQRHPQAHLGRWRPTPLKVTGAFRRSKPPRPGLIPKVAALEPAPPPKPVSRPDRAKMAGAWHATLTGDEEQGVSYYVGNGYLMLNPYLRQGRIPPHIPAAEIARSVDRVEPGAGEGQAGPPGGRLPGGARHRRDRPGPGEPGRARPSRMRRSSRPRSIARSGLLRQGVEGRGHHPDPRRRRARAAA